jgi:molybdate/tungstate transport system substrate-binding protein
MLNQILTYLVVALVLISSVGCAPQPKTPLVVFAAGSLINPFRELEIAFEKANPDIDVLAEYHGSIQVIRHATDLHEPIDVIATADHALIPALMYSTTPPESNTQYANWYALFATNKLGLAYTEGSRYADEINAGNWFDILLKPGVRVGIADPRFDASGYRTLMVYKLAEEYYGRADLFDTMFADQFKLPIQAESGGNVSVIRVPEVLEMQPDSRVVIRGSSVQLLALLESGDLDYAFEYESVIHQHNLNLVALPDELNLGNGSENPNYSRVTVILDFQRFQSVKPEFTGEQIGYGVTIPSNAPHPDAAIRFIQFLLSKDGREIMQANFHPMYDPVGVDGYDRMPEPLQTNTRPK